MRNLLEQQALQSEAAPSARRRLLDRLLERGWEFDLFQAVWLLERLNPGEVPVGERGPVKRETLRFRPSAGLGFPAADVRKISALDDGENPLCHRIEVNLLGLYGVDTPLPLHYAVQMLRWTEGEGKPETALAAEPSPPAAPGSDAAVLDDTPCAPRDLLDVFHHRAISLFYRAALKYRYHAAFGLPQRDAITRYLLWLIGCDPTWGESTLGVPPPRLLRYGGALTQHPRSASMLQGMLADYWPDTDVRVDQAVGRWVWVPAADLNAIGRANSRLGTDLTVGSAVYDLGGAFRLVLGPVDWDQYVALLPGGERFRQTCALVKLYVADPLVFTFEIHLLPDVIPPLRVSSGADAGRLGHTTWVHSAGMKGVAVSFAA